MFKNLIQSPTKDDSLDRTSPVPLYHQLKDILRSRAENGEWKPGDQIPTEYELCERYEVSKMTVKQAINGLVAEGLLYRQRGKGTFVATPKIQQGPARLNSFSEQMRQMGKRPGGRLLRREVIMAPKKLAEQIGIEVGAPVILIQRLRLADNEPLGIQTTHIPLARCPQLMDEDVGTQSLYAVLAKYDIRLTWATERYEATLLEKYEAELLQLPVGAPAFLVYRTAYDRAGIATEYVKSVMRGDRYAITVVLRSDQG